ncbi:glycosyltransferase family 2 protein [Rhodocytophaga aerolata]|nr:glycosyltransferase [Rhodocytophaga aerolata]
MESKSINNSNLPLISVIIPCFNYAHFLPLTLNSLLNQSYQNWEGIIVDDGSTDNTRQIAEQYIQKDIRFKYFYQTNQGLSAARNTGVSCSIGEYIQFLDADDLLETNKLKFQIEFLQLNSDIDVVYGRVRYFDLIYPDKILIKEEYKVSGFSGGGKSLVKELVCSNITAVHAPILRKKIFLKVKTFDVNFKSLEDWDFWWRCSFQGINFQYLPAEQTDALYRVHTSSMSKDKWKMHYAELQLREKMGKHLHDPELLKLNLSILKRIKKSLSRYAWNDSIQGKSIQGSDKFKTLFRHYNQIQFLINSELVKHMPKRLVILFYYLTHSHALVKLITNKLKGDTLAIK